MLIYTDGGISQEDALCKRAELLQKIKDSFNRKEGKQDFALVCEEKNVFIRGKVSFIFIPGKTHFDRFLGGGLKFSEHLVFFSCEGIDYYLDINGNRVVIQKILDEKNYPNYKGSDNSY